MLRAFAVLIAAFALAAAALRCVLTAPSCFFRAPAATIIFVVWLQQRSLSAVAIAIHAEAVTGEGNTI